MGVGSTIAGIAGVHGIVGLFLYSRAVGEILRDGLLATVPDFGDRATAFWFLMMALPLFVLGLCVREVERRGEPPPRALAPGLLALTAALVIPMPISGGWALLPVALWAWRRGRRSPTPSAATPQTS